MDASLYFGDLGVLLNLLSNKTICDLVEHMDDLDADLLNDIMITHSSGRQGAARATSARDG